MTKDKTLAVVDARIALYHIKQARHDPLAAGTLNDHEKVQHTIEALEELRSELEQS